MTRYISAAVSLVMAVVIMLCGFLLLKGQDITGTPDASFSGAPPYQPKVFEIPASLDEDDVLLVVQHGDRSIPVSVGEALEILEEMKFRNMERRLSVEKKPTRRKAAK